MTVSVSICSVWSAFHSGFTIHRFSTERMKSFRISLINLLGLYLIFSEDHSGCCLDTVWQPPRPNISPLQAISDKQILVVSWLVNHSGLAGNLYEIQISRAENHIIIYSANVSVPSADSHEYTWTWTSDLPLECVNHSVRIRHLYNQSFLSPWSEWVTNNGVEAKDRTKLFPLHQVLREGTSGVFCCVPPVGVNITNITLNKKKYPIISIGARVKAIVVPNLTIPKITPKVLLLTCSDTSGKGDSYIWNYVSFPPQKPRHLNCVTSDMTTVTCTWDPGRARDLYDHNKQTCTLHIENSDQAPITCGPSSCTFQAIPDLEEYNISVVVKDQLGEETASYSFNISERVSPVMEWGGVSPGITDTTLSWIVQGNLTQMNLLCQVAVDPGSTTELNCKSVSDPCEVKLQHLLPNTRYSTRARCSVDGRFWGKWTKPIPFATYPFVTLDLWRRIKQMSDPHSRQVTLLWKLDVLGSATIQGFTVHGSQEGQNRTESIPALDSEQTQAEVPIGPGQYDFTVEAVLRNGPSIPAHITIPKLDNTKNLLVEKQLNSNSAGGFNLSWAEEDTATCGFTVEWCILGNAVPCTLQWIHLPEGNNTLFLAAGNFKAGSRYTFNIYGCTENGHRLLEIQTGYSQELKAVQSPSLVEPVQITSSTVTLEWHYNEADPSHPAFITGYLVIVQEIGGHTARMFNVSDPRKKSVTIEGLKQSHKYVFSVSALTKKGPGEPAKIRITTKANYTAHLAKILTPILLLLGCTVLLWPRRKTLRRGLKKVFAYPAGMDIKTSELHSFLQETGERVQPHKVEECISCDIEILNTHPPLNESTTRRDPEPLNMPPSPCSQFSAPSLSPTCVPLQDYCPQSAPLLFEGPAPQQITCITNKSYFNSTVGYLFQPQEVAFSEIKPSFEPPDCLQESCSVVYGYISSDTMKNEEEDKAKNQI